MVVAAGAGATFAVGVEWATGTGACAGDAAEADTVDDEEDAAMAAVAAATAAATGFFWCSGCSVVLFGAIGVVDKGGGPVTVDDGFRWTAA